MFFDMITPSSKHLNQTRGYKMKAYDFICEDKNRTDAPELEYFTRFIDRLCDPEDPKEYRESLEEYPPMTDAEIAKARIQALEHTRLLDIELKRVYRVARILGGK